MAAKSVKETTVYKKAFELAMEIYKLSKSFPHEEKYSHRSGQTFITKRLYLLIGSVSEEKVPGSFCFQGNC